MLWARKCWKVSRDHLIVAQVNSRSVTTGLSFSCRVEKLFVVRHSPNHDHSQRNSSDPSAASVHHYLSSQSVCLRLKIQRSTVEPFVPANVPFERCDSVDFLNVRQLVLPLRLHFIPQNYDHKWVSDRKICSDRCQVLDCDNAPPAHTNLHRTRESGPDLVLILEWSWVLILKRPSLASSGTARPYCR